MEFLSSFLNSWACQHLPSFPPLTTTSFLPLPSTTSSSAYNPLHWGTRRYSRQSSRASFKRSCGAIITLIDKAKSSKEPPLNQGKELLSSLFYNPFIRFSPIQLGRTARILRDFFKKTCKLDLLPSNTNSTSRPSSNSSWRSTLDRSAALLIPLWIISRRPMKGPKNWWECIIGVLGLSNRRPGKEKGMVLCW